jgi:hypothetical protein
MKSMWCATMMGALRIAAARRHARRLALAGVVIAWAQPACSRSECQSYFSATPVITVVDVTTNTAICDATVLVTAEDPLGSGSGSAVESSSTVTVDSGIAGSALLRSPQSDDAGGARCTYSIEGTGALGVYTLQVSRAGYVTEVVSNVYVTSASCESSATPQSEQVVVLLHPTGS